MRTRQILAAALVLPLLAGVSVAQAAPKKKAPVRRPVCLQVKDATNDATDNGTAAVATPNDPSSDIVSADVATNATWFTAVVRLASVEPNQMSSPTGRAYEVSFLAHGKVVKVRGIVSPTGNAWFGGKGDGRVDATAKAVYIHVKVADLGIPLKPNDKLTQLRVTSLRWVGTTGVSLGTVDTAVGSVPYVAGWPTCVPKVGP